MFKAYRTVVASGVGIPGLAMLQMAIGLVKEHGHLLSPVLALTNGTRLPPGLLGSLKLTIPHQLFLTTGVQNNGNRNAKSRHNRRPQIGT